MKTTGKLLWDPEWGADIGGVAKVLNSFEIDKADAKIRDGRVSFTGYMVGNFTKSQINLNAWSSNGSFYLTGSGKVTFAVRRGLVFSALDNVCTVGLQVTPPLFYPEVALDLDEAVNPAGLVTRFARDYTGDTTLRDTSGAVAVAVQGAAAQVIGHRDGLVQAAATDVTSANLLVNISKYLAPGSYPVTISGLNGDKQPVSTTVTVVVTAGQLLTVNKTGTGSGTVTSNPAGIDCGSTCSADFTPNTVVTLTATPTAGSLFSGWSGACTGSANTCPVTMDAAKNVTATFTVTQSSSGSNVYLPLVRK